MPNLDSLADWATDNSAPIDPRILDALPAAVRNSILYGPSYAEGQKTTSSTAWPYPYRGEPQEQAAARGPQRDQALLNHMLGGTNMLPWSQMNQQQQLQLLQMMMSRGTGGMQFGGPMGANPTSQMPATPMMGGPGGIMPIQTAPGFNPLANQQQNPAMNQALMQYLMGMQAQGAPGGMQQPTMAQLLQMRGTGMGL